MFGDALASLLTEVGYTVTREYYINDAGSQVDVLARSALLRAREARGERSELERSVLRQCFGSDSAVLREGFGRETEWSFFQ